MKTYSGHSGFKALRPVVTLGMFDGVHRGHKVLIDFLVNKALATGGESVAITLEPHPRIVLSGGDDSLRFLTSLDEKKHLLEQAGLDKLMVLPFSRELSRLPACDFIKNYLVDIIGIEHLVLGFDHHFGHQGYGNMETISECAAKYGFGVDRLEALRDEDRVISSTTIRELILRGDLDRANDLLGYPYMLKGSVVKGKKIGRLLGYPTANIAPDYAYKLIPADGVYAAEAVIEGIDYKAMLYIGPRPTIEGDKGRRSIEVNIFDFDRDIYDKAIVVKFRHRLRGDKKFSSREQLLQQIKKDKAESVRLLSS